MPKRKSKKTATPKQKQKAISQNENKDEVLDNAEKNQLIEEAVFCFFNITDTLQELFTEFKPSNLTKVIVVGQENVDITLIGQLINVKELWITECNLQVSSTQ